MQTRFIQCDVDRCPERCSEQDREQPGIPDAPPPRTAAWICFQTSDSSARERWLCPSHALMFHALMAGRVEINIQIRSTMDSRHLAREHCPCGALPGDFHAEGCLRVLLKEVP